MCEAQAEEEATVMKEFRVSVRFGVHHRQNFWHANTGVSLVLLAQFPGRASLMAWPGNVFR